MNLIEIKGQLNWLFDLNQNRKDFTNFILSQNKDFSNRIVEVVKELRYYNTKGIQEKFGKFGFNENDASLHIRSRLRELEVGCFLLKKGEKVKFLEGHSTPDLISGKEKFNKIWEITSVFNIKELRRLWIGANKIIKNWDVNVKVKIDISVLFSHFRPKRAYHKIFEDLVNGSLEELRKTGEKIKADKLTPEQVGEYTKMVKDIADKSSFINGKKKEEQAWGFEEQ